ncbi:MAG: hypothetical protein ACRD06_04235 [Terriglobia bacterium]
MNVALHPHAKQRMAERGATEREVISTVELGERFPAKFGRTGFRRNFAFGAEWLGHLYILQSRLKRMRLKRMVSGWW